MRLLLKLILSVLANLTPSVCTASLHTTVYLFSGISHLITHFPNRRTS